MADHRLHRFHLLTALPWSLLNARPFSHPVAPASLPRALINGFYIFGSHSKPLK